MQNRVISALREILTFFFFSFALLFLPAGYARISIFLTHSHLLVGLLSMPLRISIFRFGIISVSKWESVLNYEESC